jgi:hypothetical protein
VTQQQALLKARDKEQAEQTKAMQLQQQANASTAAATRQAQQSQQAASQGLTREQQLAQRGTTVLSGNVMQVTPNHLVVQRQDGLSMKFRVTPQTYVSIDGKRASTAQILQGENALVSYQMSGTEPQAINVQVVTGKPQGGGGGSQQGTGGQSGSSGSSQGGGQ